MSEKKDILEFPLENVSVPQAIALMMGAASKCGTAWCDEQENAGWSVDDTRLAELCEKLEARIQDEVENAAPAVAPVEDDTFEEADMSRVILVHREEGDDAALVVYKGVVYGKFCNVPVHTAFHEEESTHCIKQFGHTNPIHEDEFGNERA